MELLTIHIVISYQSSDKILINWEEIEIFLEIIKCVRDIEKQIFHKIYYV